MTERPSDIVVLGLSLSSSWGNGHATTYRALLRGLYGLGQKVLFLERDVPWYAENRDLPQPDFCELAFYRSLDELRERFAARIASAGMVIVGSFVPEGIAVIDTVFACAKGVTGFYDIDTPITLTNLGTVNETYLAARQIPKFDLYFSFTGGPTLDHLARKFAAKRARALYCAVDETTCRPVKTALRWDLGYLGTYSPDRQPVLERLLLQPARTLSHLRFVVAGPQYPAAIVWPDNVERVEHLAPAQHAAFYGAQKFTLNLTRAAMVAAGWSPSVRLFEAASCGTPIISDRWAGLSDLLPEQAAVLVADHTADVLDALTNLSERARQGISATARSIVLDQHTGTARARALQHEVQSVAIGQRHTAQ